MPFLMVYYISVVKAGGIYEISVEIMRVAPYGYGFADERPERISVNSAAAENMDLAVRRGIAANYYERTAPVMTASVFIRELFNIPKATARTAAKRRNSAPKPVKTAVKSLKPKLFFIKSIPLRNHTYFTA